MWTNNQDETDYFLSFLKSDMRVLEFGSGSSTASISERVKEVVSIEHNKQWYEKVKETIGKNVNLVYVAQNREPLPSYDDGTYEDFKDYILSPLKIAAKEKFDLVFVDGRARVECCRYAANYYLKEDGVIILHDYNHPEDKWKRFEYDKVLDFLEPIGQVFTMGVFKVKRNG